MNYQYYINFHLINQFQFQVYSTFVFHQENLKKVEVHFHFFLSSSSNNRFDNSYIFLLTTEDEILYGVCLYYYRSNQDNIINSSDKTPVAFNPQEMTKQERLSRLLHTPKVRKSIPSVGPLLDHFIIVAPTSQTEKKKDELSILYQFPPDKPVSIPGILDFCFPSGSKPKESRGPLSLFLSSSSNNRFDNSYIFLLTTEDEILYGVCLYYYRSNQDSSLINSSDNNINNLLNAPVLCFCIITRFPFFKLHFEVIESIIEHLYPTSEDQKTNRETILSTSIENFSESTLKSLKIEEETQDNLTIAKILRAFYKLQPPEPGRSVYLYASSNSKVIQYKRVPRGDEEEAFAEWSLSYTLQFLSRKQLFFLLSAVLLEKKIALVSSNLRLLSSVVLSFIPLIRPFIYQSSIIPILPDKLHSFLEAPVPFLVGITIMPPAEECPKDVIFFQIESGTIGGCRYEDLPNLPGLSDLYP